MSHSTVTSKGQTTIPGEIRKALQINPGDKLEYMMKGDHATIRVHPGTRSLKGMLDSKKGNGFCPNPGGRRESVIAKAFDEQQNESFIVARLISKKRCVEGRALRSDVRPVGFES
jgi:AbrB family looped-hinge helix DNA binding protein